MSSSRFLAERHFDLTLTEAIRTRIRQVKLDIGRWKLESVYVVPHMPSIRALVRSFREEDVILKETRRRARR